MKFFTFPAVMAAALFSAVVVQPWLPSARQHSVFALEARVSSTRAGYVQVYPDTGTGFFERTSVRLPIAANTAVTLQFSLPTGNFRALRFDPLDSEATVTLDRVRFIKRGGRTVREILPADWRAANQIGSLRANGEQLVVQMAPGASDPQLSLTFDPPMPLDFTRLERTEDFLGRWLAVFTGLGLVLLLLDRRSADTRQTFSAALAWCGATPLRALTLGGAIAVIASAYPIVFLGKSYVSPDFGTLLLYETFPTLPGYHSDGVADLRGSDVGTLAWQDMPDAVIQRSALAAGEAPLWNRYNSCGTTLLGQGQSMFGDPLHFLPILANSAAWAWDLKYLLAKCLFATGLGLCVLAIAGQLPAALLTAAAAPFIGFFVYRVNHPAFFSVCYSPWVLVTWLNFVKSPNRRAAAGWLAGLVLANWTLLNSGTVKEAYMLLLCLNLAGAATLLGADQPWRERLSRLAAASWAGLIFVLLALPVLLTFSDTLAGSYTSYNAPSAYQIQPELLLGFFDEIFYRPLSEGELLFNPAMNLLLLGGLLYFLATLRENLAVRPAVALGATALLPLALAFGFIPARWIVQVPFLANVAHVDNTFSCVLIVITTVLAGLGFARAFERLGTPAGRADLVIAGLLLFALVFGYVAFTQAVHRSVFGYGTTFTFMKPGDALPVKPFVWAYLGLGVAALVGGALTLRRALAAKSFNAAAGILLLTCALVLVWRNALHARPGYETYVAIPTTRADPHARSEAVAFMQGAVAAEPARGVGLRDNFFPGWTAIYQLESVGGPDALMNPRYRELMEVSGLNRRWDWNYVLTGENVAAARPLFDALNVRFYLDYKSDPGRPPAGLRLARAADMEVYESPTTWPRAFFTDRIATYENAADFVRQVRAGDGRPFAAALKSDLATNRALGALPRGVDGRTVAAAANYRLTANTTSFKVQASGPGIAVLSEVHFPGDFHAEVDGRDAAIVPINHAFKGVVIDRAGEHAITVRYQPRHFGLASLAALTGLLLLGGSFGLAWRKPTQS